VTETSICLFAGIFQEPQPTSSNFTEFPMHAACGRGSVQRWRRRDVTLCTSGFVDDVIFDVIFAAAWQRRREWAGVYSQ